MHGSGLPTHGSHATPTPLPAQTLPPPTLMRHGRSMTSHPPRLWAQLKYGRIIDIDLKIPPRPPGYAFVEFEDPRDAEDAIAGRDGYNFHGNRLSVEPVHGGRGNSSSFDVQVASVAEHAVVCLGTWNIVAWLGSMLKIDIFFLSIFCLLP